MMYLRPIQTGETVVDASPHQSPGLQETFELPPAKRQKIVEAAGRRMSSLATSAMNESPSRRGSMGATTPSYDKGDDASRRRDKQGSRRGSDSVEPILPKSSPTTSKPKRVRTGCLTCRNRHLKCDEAMPVCMNCQKSSRKCERGVRLNFIDLKVEQPPYLLPRVHWKVQFLDESRQIASEYVGGLARYAKLGQQVTSPPQVAELNIESRPQRVAEPALSGRGQSIENAKPPRPQHPPSFYYPGGLPRAQEPSQNSYDDQLGHMLSRKGSDSFLAMGSGPTPTASQTGVGGRAASFSLGTAQDAYGRREEPIEPAHNYKTSDVSSVASSLAPQGMAASSSGSLRNATGSGPPDPHDGLMTPQSEKNGERNYLNSPEEIHYMQVFIDEVAIWMDSLDNQKHFGSVIPYLALKSPMLMNAFLACGVKYLTLVDGGSYKDDKALYYYDTATTQLLRSLQNPERNTAECATTAVVLNVYEIMSEKPAARMNHIAGARALIRECKWDARSTGIGAACFWLNVAMEVLSCLAFNWATAWDPDHWGMDPDDLMTMTASSTSGTNGKGLNDFRGNRNDVSGRAAAGAGATPDDFPSTAGSVAGVGDEEIWLHRILYIVAKVANFRANIPQFQEPSPHDEQVRLQSRFAEWQRLKSWCDTWNASCPRSMKPYGYLFSSSTKSAFPNVWLIKRSAIVGRLFYHTAMCLLAQINPLKTPQSQQQHHQQQSDDDEARAVQLHHAHQVCGIVAHTKDHGVASVAIRSLAIAGAVLQDPREQHEVVDILTRIYHHTGWNLKRVHLELKRAWGWEPPEPPGTGNAAGLAPPQQPQQQKPRPTIITPAAQGGTLGAAAVVSQLFGPRDANGNSIVQQQDSSINSGGSNNNKNNNEDASRRASQSGLPIPSHPQHTTLSHSLFSSSSSVGASRSGRHGSVASPSSHHTSPASTSTPPFSGSTSRPTVNPLLAQADFTQPNHPYREWYKPPDRPAEKKAASAVERAPGRLGGGVSGARVGPGTARSSLGTGGLWPY